MMNKPETPTGDSREGFKSHEQDRLIEQLRWRIAELENTNRLLTEQIAESRRAEMSGRGR
jgi:hypothetical protein